MPTRRFHGVHSPDFAMSSCMIISGIRVDRIMPIVMKDIPILREQIRIILAALHPVPPPDAK